MFYNLFIIVIYHILFSCIKYFIELLLNFKIFLFNDIMSNDSSNISLVFCKFRRYQKNKFSSRTKFIFRLFLYYNDIYSYVFVMFVQM